MAKGKTIVYLTDDETAFLNVDVGVFAKYPLEPLAAALGTMCRYADLQR